MSMATVNDVGKKRAKAAERKPMVVQVRGSEEWKAWSEGLARFDSRPLASLVEHLFRRYAKEIGYKPEPPER